MKESILMEDKRMYKAQREWKPPKAYPTDEFAIVALNCSHLLFCLVSRLATVVSG